MSNDVSESAIRAIAEEVIDYINAEAQYELRAPFTSNRVAAIVSKHLAAPEQSPRVCVKCHHPEVFLKDTRCSKTFWGNDEPSSVCGCHCSFPVSVPDAGVEADWFKDKEIKRLTDERNQLAKQGAELWEGRESARRVAEQLANFTSHHDDCSWFDSIPRLTCSCGLADALESLTPATGEEK